MARSNSIFIATIGLVCYITPSLSLFLSLPDSYCRAPVFKLRKKTHGYYKTKEGSEITTPIYRRRNKFNNLNRSLLYQGTLPNSDDIKDLIFVSISKYR